MARLFGFVFSATEPPVCFGRSKLVDISIVFRSIGLRAPAQQVGRA